MFKHFRDFVSMVVMEHCFPIRCLLPLTPCNNYRELLMNVCHADCKHKSKAET